MVSFVYTLVSTGEDNYLEQVYASMFSLKYHMPDAHIVLIIDEATKGTLTGTREKEIQYADQVIVIPLDAGQYTAKQRSRILKSSVRQHLRGDFLYIDCDTIIAKPLDSIEDIPYEIAACMDTHSYFIDNPYRQLCITHGHLLGWPVENEEVYYNSGVIYVKDCPLCYDFYEKWNRNLIEGFKKEVNMDQPSFAKTNYEMGHPVKTLDDVWNCELKHGIRYLKDARIIHYLTTNASPRTGKQLFRLNDVDLFMEMKETGKIPDEIRTICQDPFKGIAPLTHCFSGDDVYLFQLPFFKNLYKEEASFKTLLNEDKETKFYQTGLYRYFAYHYPNALTAFLQKMLNWVKALKRVIR